MHTRLTGGLPAPRPRQVPGAHEGSSRGIFPDVRRDLRWLPRGQEMACVQAQSGKGGR